MSSYDVIVAGVGAMGSAAMDRLTRRGARVLGIEPFEIPHGEGSSGGDTRLIRKAYFEHPDYVPLLERAYQHWHALEEEGGERLLHETGTVYLGDPGGEVVAGSLHSAARHGLSLERLDPDELRRRWPQFSCPDGYVALFEPEAGFVLCERAVDVQARLAVSRGATLVVGERLRRWHADGDGVAVETDRGRYRGGALVLTVGSWAGPFVADLGVSLSVTRQSLFWVAGDPEGTFSLDRSPCWAVQRPDAPGLCYGFPSLGPGLGSETGVKLARHFPGEPVEPGADREPASAEELDALLASVTPFVSGLAGPMTASRTCLYTNSEDGHFVVDRHPDHAGVVFACGFSGHGFKFAPAMGEALAELVLDGRSSLPVEFLRHRGRPAL